MLTDQESFVPFKDFSSEHLHEFGEKVLQRPSPLEEIPPSLESVVGQLRVYWELRQKYHRTEKILTLQIKALCRSLYPLPFDFSKKEGEKYQKNPAAEALYKALCKNDTSHPQFDLITLMASSLIEARCVLEKQRLELEKRYHKYAKFLPGYEFCIQTPGISPNLLVSLYAEASGINNRGLLDFGTPYRLFKRLGIGVMDDHTRQRRIAGPDAIKHGYVAERRSMVWTYGQAIIFRKIKPFYDKYVQKLHEEMPRWNQRNILVLPAEVIVRIKAADLARKQSIADKAILKCHKQYPDFYPSSFTLNEQTEFRNMAHYRSHCKRMMEKYMVQKVWEEARKEAGCPEWDYTPLQEKTRAFSKNYAFLLEEQRGEILL